MIPEVGAIYRHQNGNLYKVIGLAKHSETLEDMVIYEPQYECREFPGKLWARPLSNWLSLRGGKPRFERVS
ncbi:MAG: DUF1653 domain-containing protein [Alphaproteobacteria bacterium]|nr:DUF1653 domain-containing protein [Alphaproteobacteria bacterium]